MNQLEKAKEAVKHLKDDGNTNHSLYAMSECLLSIAISLDEKNKANNQKPTRPMTLADLACSNDARIVDFLNSCRMQVEELEDVKRLIEDAKKCLVSFPDDKGLKLSLMQLEHRKVKLENTPHGKSL